MSGLKTNKEITRSKAMLNTTIDKEVFDDFKATCKATGMRMSTLLETFMKQYNEGEFTVKFVKNKRILELEDT